MQYRLTGRSQYIRRRPLFVPSTGITPGITDRPKIKISGSFALKPIKIKEGGSFTEKQMKVKVSGTFVNV